MKSFFEECDTDTDDFYVYYNKRFDIVLFAQEQFLDVEETFFEQIWMVLVELFENIFGIERQINQETFPLFNEAIVKFNKLYIAQHDADHVQVIFASNSTTNYTTVEMNMWENDGSKTIDLVKGWLDEAGENVIMKSVDQEDVLLVTNSSLKAWQALTGWLRI